MRTNEEEKGPMRKKEEKQRSQKLRKGSGFPVLDRVARKAGAPYDGARLQVVDKVHRIAYGRMDM